SAEPPVPPRSKLFSALQQPRSCWNATQRRTHYRRGSPMNRYHTLFALVAVLALGSAAMTQARAGTLITARPDFQNQLYLAAPTNAPGTSLAQTKSIALFS